MHKVARAAQLQNSNDTLSALTATNTVCTGIPLGLLQANPEPHLVRSAGDTLTGWPASLGWLV
jgi:hypothetical protein